jgi:hypothetical protein
MGKNKLSSGLINVVTYDTDNNISLNSGSNLLMSLSGSGVVTIPGNLVVLGGIAGSNVVSSSYSLNADKIDNLDSTQLVLTSSFNSHTSSVSSSIGSLSGSIATTTSDLSSSIGSLSGSIATTTNTLSSSVSSSIGSLSGSVATTTSGLAGRITTIEGNYATTGSNIFVGNQVITGSICSTGNIVTTGQIVAQTINVQQVTSSIVYSCGSNIFGCSLSNTQVFTGSMLITGSNITAKVDTACFSGHLCSNTLSVSGTSNLCDNLSVGNYNICPSITLVGVSVGGFREGYLQWGTGNQTTAGLHINSPGTNLEMTTGFNERIVLSTGTGLQVYTNAGNGPYNSRFLLDRSGNGCFSGMGCFGSDLLVSGIYRDFAGEALLQTNTSCITLIGSGAAAAGRALSFLAGNNSRLCISTTGIATFTCQICSPSFVGGTVSGTTGNFSGNVIVNRVNSDSRLLISQSSSSAPYTATLELSSQGVGTYGATVQYDAAPENLTIENYGRSTNGLSRGDIRFRTKVNNTTPTDVLSLNGFSGTATFSSSVVANSLLVERSVSRNMLGISSISLPTSGDEEGVAVIKTNSSIWQLSTVGYALDSKGVRFYNNGGTGHTAFEVAQSGGTRFIVNGVGNVGIGETDATSRLTLRPPSCTNASTIEFTNSDNAVISSHYNLTIAVNNSSTQSGRAIVLASGNKGYGNQCSVMASFDADSKLTTLYGAVAQKSHNYHTNGQWYKIPFFLEKGNGAGIADTRCIVVINNNDQFQELHFTIEYGSRLQGVTDQYTQTSLRTYGVNRFVGSTATINDVYLITGGSGCNINTHAPVTVAIAGSCMSVVKVDFSSSLGSSSFVWGEIRVWSIESLSGKISIPNNNY